MRPARTATRCIATARAKETPPAPAGVSSLVYLLRLSTNFSNFSFSRQISSISSASTTMRCFKRDGPWLRVGLGIVDGHRDVEVSEIRATDLFAYLGRLGQRASVPIDPRVVAQSNRIDHQRIARPLGGRVSLPRRGRVFGQRPAIREDLAVSGVHFIEHDQQTAASGRTSADAADRRREGNCPAGI